MFCAKQNRLQTKALAVIEAMVSLQEPESGILASIYRLAHVGLGECGNAHDDWARELDDMYDKLVEHRVL